MGAGTSQTIQVNVSVAQTGLPAWLQGAAIGEWRQIPNSSITNLLLDYVNDPRIGMTYVNNGNGVQYPDNHYGLNTTSSAAHKTAGQYRYTFGGMAFDSGRYSGRAPSLMAAGEEDFPENSVVRCNPFLDVPFWDIAMWGGHATDYKHRAAGAPLNASQFTFTGTTSFGSKIITGITGVAGTQLPTPFVTLGTFTVGQVLIGSGIPGFPAGGAAVEAIISPTSISIVVPADANGTASMFASGSDGWDNNKAVHHPFGHPERVDDPRPQRFYDGAPRGAHTQQRFHFIGQRNWFVQVGCDLQYPDDKGVSGQCAVGDLTAGAWVYDYPNDTMPSFPVSQGDVVEKPRIKHEITEDLYIIRNNKIYKWTQATNTWNTSYWTNPDTNNHSLDDSCADINWQANYMLVASLLRPGQSASTGSVYYWTVPLTGASPVHTEVVTFTGNAAAIATIHGATFANIKNFSLKWIPDWGAFLMTAITTAGGYNLFKLTLTNSTTLDVQPYAPSGTAPVGAATAMNNIHYVSYPMTTPTIKGILFRVYDTALMYFVRTA